MVDLLRLILRIITGLALYVQGRKAEEAEQTEDENEALKDRMDAERDVAGDAEHRRRVLDASIREGDDD